MIEGSRAARRSFLGSVIAALGAVCWPRMGLDVKATLDAPDAQPGGGAQVDVRAPALADGTLVLLTWVIQTPRETMRLPAGELVIHRGRGQVERSLPYPYEELVAGGYRLRMELQTAGQSLPCGGAVSYRIGEPACLA